MGKRTLVDDRRLADTVQSLVDSLPAHIAIIDTAYTILFVNQPWRGYCDLFNFDLAAYGVGDNYFDVGLNYGSVDSVKVADMAAAIDLVARGDVPQITRTYEASLSDGHHYFMLTISPFVQSGARLLMLSHTDVTPAVRLAEAHRDLALSLLRAELDERRRVARELHDVTAQSIAAIGVGHANLRRADSEEGRQSIFTELDALVSEVSRQIRLYSYFLHSPEFDKTGLKAALEVYVDGLAHRTGLSISFDWQVENRAKIVPYEAALLRIAQEALWNVYQHSGAETAVIAISDDDDAVFLTISDTGKGIDLSKPHTGLGLQTMRSRAEELGGQLMIYSSKRGTRIVAHFPPAAVAGPRSLEGYGPHQAPGAVRADAVAATLQPALFQSAERSTAVRAKAKEAVDRSRKLFATALAHAQEFRGHNTK
jgi:signal transduction histidine kinase